MTDLESLKAAYALLPAFLNSTEATLQLLTVRRQEAPNMEQVQGGGGPARGTYQFESAGGVRGVLQHAKAGPMARKFVESLGIPATEKAVYDALALAGPADVLDAGMARLFLYTDPQPLPKVGDEEAAAQYYWRTWRPGAYTKGTPEKKAALRKKWGKNYAEAMQVLGL